MKDTDHIKTVADDIALSLVEEYARIAPHIIGMENKQHPLDTLMIAVAWALIDMYGERARDTQNSNGDVVASPK